MARRRYELGKAEEAIQPETLKAIVAEFLATFTFVFATEGSILALGMSSHTHYLNCPYILDNLNYIRYKYYFIFLFMKSKMNNYESNAKVISSKFRKHNRKLRQILIF